MVAFKDFDLVRSFCSDYMHNVLLGVFKSMFSRWIDTTNKHQKYYIKKKNRELLDLRLLSIKKCSFIGRPLRSIKKLTHFKANEFRSLLLFYLRNCLTGLLPKEYIDHFQILSTSAYSLLRNEIPFDELDLIDKNLRKFVQNHQLLYGESSMTMNVHLISHLVECVRSNGPLWSTSMFAFESNNGHLLRLFNGTRDVLQQITSKYILKHVNFVQNPTKSIQKSIVLSDAKDYNLNENYKKVFSEMEISVVSDEIPIFTAVDIGTERYTCTQYKREKKSCNYVVKFNNFLYGKIHFYFRSGNIDLMMVETLEVKEQIDHIFKVAPSKLMIAEISAINEKLVFYEVRNNYFISSRPNPYERD